MRSLSRANSMPHMRVTASGGGGNTTTTYHRHNDDEVYYGSNVSTIDLLSPLSPKMPATYNGMYHSLIRPKVLVHS